MCLLCYQCFRTLILPPFFCYRFVLRLKYTFGCGRFYTLQFHWFCKNNLDIRKLLKNTKKTPPLPWISQHFSNNKNWPHRIIPFINDCMLIAHTWAYINDITKPVLKMPWPLHFLPNWNATSLKSLKITKICHNSF